MAHKGSLDSRLRILASLLFIPGFPLCLIHGILKHHPVPAVGLVPQFFSIVTTVLVLCLRRKNGDDADNSDPSYSIRDILVHPITVFGYDFALAAAYMIVLVFTWINVQGAPGLSMLAAYATIPLFTCFFIHSFLALRAMYYGLAIHQIVQWFAWRAVPPNCPNCNVRLRSSFPGFPWLGYFRGRSDGYAAIPAMEEDRYRDDVDEENGIAPREPEAVDILSKSRKGKAIDASWQE